MPTNDRQDAGSVYATDRTAPPEGMIDYKDYGKVRSYFQQRVLDSMSTLEPVSNDRFELAVEDVHYENKSPGVRDEEMAMRSGKTLARRLKGRYRLTDKSTGAVFRSGGKTLMNVPWMTRNGFYLIKGVPYAMARQFRMDPGVYTRVTDDGVPEAQVNVEQGTGIPFKIRLEPKTGVFVARLSGKSVPLYKLLNQMGVGDDELKRTWGTKLLAANRDKKPHSSAASWLSRTVEREKERMASESNVPADTIRDGDAMRSYLGRRRLSEANTKRIMGTPYARVTPELLVHTSKRILDVANGRAHPDSRDNPSNQRLFDEGDHMATYLKLDHDGLFRTALWKLRNDPKRLKRIPTGLFDGHVRHHMNNSGLAQVLEQINPLDAMVQSQRVTRLGEGAISDVQGAPQEARNVQPGYFGFIDSIKAPESMKIGLDMYLARTSVKGPDNKIYARFKDNATGKTVWLNPVQLEDEFTATPEDMKSSDRYIVAMSPKHGMRYLPKKDIKYSLVNGDDLFTASSDSIALKSSVKGMRQAMGSKFVNHALPLNYGEQPLVQTPTSDGTPSAKFLGNHAGAVRSGVSGDVVGVDARGATIRDDNGELHREEWYKWVPMARKTYLEQSPVVKEGDRVEKGDLLARSNYTDDKGNLSIGVNLRTAFMPWRGYNFEDAVVISEGAAKGKLSSNHMYTTDYETPENTEVSRSRFESLFPTVYGKDQMAKLDKHGVVKVGSTVNNGDPIILAVKSRDPSTETMGRKAHSDSSETWDHEEPGYVRDVVKTKDGYRLFITSNHPMRVGDKLANPMGGKGTVSLIVPDDQMAKDSEGRTIELIISPKSVPSRVNPAIVTVAKLAKVAEKTGKPYIVEGYSDEDLVDLADRELKAHDIPDTETIHDPQTGRDIEGIGTGLVYTYKMQQEAEAKGHARETGGYSMDDDPARGPGGGAKHIGGMESSSLLASGATEVLKDLKTIHGQANHDFWRQLKLGGTPAVPKVPAVYDKFRALVQASGVNLQEGTPTGDRVFAATNKDIEALTGNRKITSGETYDRKMRPRRGGLFDPDATASLGAGDRFAYIELPEPMLNPLMTPAIRHMLGIRKVDLDDIMAGRKQVNGKVGGEALKSMLDNMDLKSMVSEAKATLKDGTSAQKRDSAAKRLMFAQAMIDHDTKPSDFMMTRVPVLPPKFRNIVEQGDRLVVPDLNYLYRRLIHASDDFQEAVDERLGPEAIADARDTMLGAYRALVGTEAPRDKDLQTKRVGGVLQQLLSKGSPKSSFVQRKALGFNIDLSGLGVVVPNPRLTLDQVGIPEDYAFKLYGPMVIRRMVRAGRGATGAAEAVRNKTQEARRALADEMEVRPVMMNRAPTLHRYGIMGFRPKLVPGKAIQVNPQITGPFGMDFDGNCLDFNERVSLRFSKSSLETFDCSVYAEGIGSNESDNHSKKGMEMIEAQTNVDAKRGETMVELPIGNFPRHGSPMKDKNGADVYEVPPGVEVLSYDIVTNKPVFAKVTHFTEEFDCECVEVKYGARRVVISANESLAMFDYKDGGLVKVAPADAEDMLTPRLADAPPCFGDYGTRELGWWVGAFVSDGWVSGHTVGHSKLSDDIVQRFSDVTESLFKTDYKKHEYVGREGGSFGRSRKVHYNSMVLADHVRKMGFYNEAREDDYTGARSARFKQIPPSMLARGSEEFLWGIVSGLLDGDSSLVRNKAKKKTRYYARFNTSSPWLRDGIVSLFLRLGVQCGVTETPARGKSAESWIVIPATDKLKEKLGNIDCSNSESREFLAEWAETETDRIGNRQDVIPLTLDEAELMRRFAYDVRDMSAYAAAGKYKRHPRVHRSTAIRIAEKHPDALQGVLNRARSSVTWEQVNSVESVGKRDVYDLVVEGTKVFAIAGGIIVYDTASLTVPVSQSAVQEVYDRMLPSKNLISRQKGQPHYTPSQETHEGLYIMSKRPSAKPVKTFDTEKEALAAYERGEIAADDPVRIREND